MSRKISRRAFLGASAAAGAAACGRTKVAKAEKKGRVVILGFDGVEPGIIDTMLSAGRLPNLDALRKQGGYQRLRSTIPPQSPTAWASFATCKNPGQHGIYDFLRRDPKTYFPGIAAGSIVKPVLGPDGSLAKPARFDSFRRGDTFWAIADGQGTRCKVLSMPFSFPADDLANGQMLCTLGVPDLRGTTSTFFSLSDSFTSKQLSERLSGGMRIPLKFEEGVAKTMIPGPPDVTKQRGVYAEAPITVKADREAHTAAISIQDKEVTLEQGRWSDWFEWTFEVTPKFKVRALSRLYILEVGQRVQIYMTCLQFHPKDPYMVFTSPPSYSAELADRYGLYKTIGWAYDTHALRQDAITEDMFLEDIRRTMAWRETLTLDEMSRDDWDMLISVWTATDRAAHMFWRFRDPQHPLYTAEGAEKYGQALESTYEKADEIVGKVMSKLQENDLLIVLSDHGFHSFRKGFNVNTWLIREGYLAVKGQSDPKTSYNDQGFLLGYDWAHTKAYGLGLGSVYLNLKDRESQGTVAPEDAPALRAEIREKLLQVTDPETGAKIFKDVHTVDVYHGAAVANAPDLELGYVAGYQSTKSAAKGAAPHDLFESNVDKWSGDHVATDVSIAPGMLFSNTALAVEPAIMDLGVTALNYLGVPVPDDFEGKALA